MFNMVVLLFPKYLLLVNVKCFRTKVMVCVCVCVF